ncbi:hypothetical protein ACHAW6_006785 [Cyclotella cf. meneghiniana]
MQLLEEMKSHGFEVVCSSPHVFCKTFEDNSGALELACLLQLRPCTSTSMFVMIIFVNMSAKIFVIDTENQIADTLPKPLPQNAFCCHRKHMRGQ